ncbi:MAG TPA: hypothetical protein PLJ12_07715, partial [Planctomycetota bacterium]|nr:hypothetical protein [Planctomycetota bacterium]
APTPLQLPAMRFEFVLSWFALVLFACGSKPTFTGNYTGSYMSQPVQLQLQQEGSTLTGTLTYTGISAPIQAQVKEAVASGTVNIPMMGGMQFEATRQPNGSVEWKYLTPFPGQFQAIALTFERQESGKTAAASKAAGNLDPALVGAWRSTVSSSVPGAYPGDNFNTATDIYCTLSADGTFQYGGAVTGASGSGFTGVTDPAQTLRGQWKAEGGVLYSRTDANPNWIPLGQYTVSGNSMVVNSGGDKQLWER